MDAEEALRLASERFASAFRAIEAVSRAADADVAAQDAGAHAAVWGAVAGLDEDAQ